MQEHHTTCKTTKEDTHTSKKDKKSKEQRKSSGEDKRRSCEHEKNHEQHPQDNILKTNEYLTNRTFTFYTFFFTSTTKRHDMKMSYSQAASASSSSSVGCASKAPAEAPTTPHAAMHWSACFNDRCDVHLRDTEGANWFPKQPRRNQPRRQAKKVHWGEPAGLGNKCDDMAKFVEELQEGIERMEKEMGDLQDENRSYKRRCVVAKESARKAGIEARRRA